VSDERFIPFLRSEVAALCTSACAEGERGAAEEFHRLLAGVVHQGYRSRLRTVEQDYFLLHPPEYARRDEPPPPERLAQARGRLEQTLADLARGAAFTRVSRDELAESMRSHALLRVRMDLPEGTEDGAMLFRRGKETATAQVRAWFGMRTRTVEYVRYARVLVYVHTDEVTALKLFEDVPRDDMEMLLPGARPRMRLVDKLLILIPALISGIALVATKLISAIGLLVLLFAFWVGLRDSPVEVNRAAVVTVGAGLIALVGYVARQYRKYTRRRLQFMNTLANNLYYRNLDNEAGVFYRLLGAAEDAEYVQAVLAYHALRTAPVPLTESRLAGVVEGCPALQRGRTFRFAAGEAVETLDRLGLTQAEPGDGTRSVLGLDDARRRLRALWAESAG